MIIRRLFAGRLTAAAILSGALLLAGAAAVSFAAQAAEDRAPGTVFKDCAECPEMVVVAAGRFTMGADDDDKHARPAVAVTVAKPFAIGRFEVTFDDYQVCLDAGACQAAPDDHAWGRGRRPVINLTYDEIATYVNWLSVKTGQAYRLPTEAEWEYAHRAGSDSRYWWGDEAGNGHANCRQCGSEFSGLGTAPVGSFAANPFGLFDTAGNVWEWVADCWQSGHQGRPSDAAARPGGNCEQRVIRGGSWYYVPRLSSNPYRYFNAIGVKSYNIGFRVARDLD